MPARIALVGCLKQPKRINFPKANTKNFIKMYAEGVCIMLLKAATTSAYSAGGLPQAAQNNKFAKKEKNMLLNIKNH
jgi:hypothetical protein